MIDPETYPLHGGQLREIAERFGIFASELLDFSANINPSGPPPAVLASLRASLDDLSTLTEYPDLRQTELKSSIASYAGTRQEHVVVANGFVPLLEAALRTLDIRSCLLPVPCFVEYRRTLRRAGIEVVPHALSAESCFRYDPAALLGGRPDAILLANPQNPSGVCHDAALMQDLVEKASATNTYVLLDEAFIDYVPEQSLTALTEEYRNLIVFRSVTKFHGIPGLRAAYAVANRALAKSIDGNLPPWPITTLASRAVAAALAERAYAERARVENGERRAELQSDLESMGLHVYSSAANFLLFRLAEGIDPAALWRRMLLEHRIVLRFCGNYEGLPAGHFRAAVRTAPDHDRLVSALKACIGRSN